MAYTTAIDSVTYYVANVANNAFIPGNCQAPTNSHDNPDNGTKAQRQASCEKTSPLCEVAVPS
jgi:hypothetical protein